MIYASRKPQDTSGIIVDRTASKAPYQRGLHAILQRLNSQCGTYFSSGYEYPERYARWDIAAVARSLEIVPKGRELTIHALNGRGAALTRMLE